MTIMERINKKRGFTLIEVVVVMAIIAVLAVLVVGAIVVARRLTKETQLKDDAKNLQTQLEAYYVQHRNFPPSNPAVGYNKVDGYSLYAPTSTSSNNARQATGRELSDIVDAPYPTPPDDGMICYSRSSNKPDDYWLWILTADEWGTTVNDKDCMDGFIGASVGSKIHCPNGVTRWGCSSQYWY